MARGLHTGHADQHTNEMKISLHQALAALPLPATCAWPEGVFNAEILARHGLVVEIFAPHEIDHQTPHDRDELYVVVAGSAEFKLDQSLGYVRAGDLILVPALTPHRFLHPSFDFATWVIFFGPLARAHPTSHQSIHAETPKNKAT